MKKLKKLLFLVLALVFFVACSNRDKAAEENKEVAEVKTEEATETKEDNKVEEASEGELVKFVDDAGREVEIPAKINSVAPSGALAQQVILGVVPDRLVAISSKVKNESSQKILAKFNNLPEIGQFYGKGDFNAESLASANPDIIVDIGEPKKTVVEDMDGITEKSGKPAIFVELNFDNAGEAYRKLGKIFGEEEKAEKLAQYVERVHQEVKDGMEKIGDQKLTFVYLTGDNGLGSNPKGSFHMQMLDMMGNNVFVSEEKSSKGGGNEISQEELLALNPDVIIFGPGSIYDSVAENPAFAELKAIKEGKYVEVPSVPYNWVGFPPSVNRFMGAQWLGKLFYPEVFDYDLKERITEYFDLFYGYELSEDEYNMFVEKAFFKN